MKTCAVTALRFLFWKRKSTDANGKLRRKSARESEETWLFDNRIWMMRGCESFAISLRLILRSAEGASRRMQAARASWFETRPAGAPHHED